MNSNEFTDAAKKQVRQAVRMLTYHNGPSVTYQDVERELIGWKLSPWFIAAECEMAGCPVWSSAPTCAMALGANR